MALEPYVCPSCGARISPEKWKDTIYCEYCHSSFRPKDAKRQPPPVPPAQPYIQIQKKYIPPRPKFGCFLTVFLFLMGFWPGVIYTVVMLYQQSVWDKEYKNKL